MAQETDDFFIHTVEDFLQPSYFKALRNRALAAPCYRFVENTAMVNADVTESNRDNGDISDVGQAVYAVLVGRGAPLDQNMFTFIEPLIFSVYDTFPQYQFNGINRAKFNILPLRPERGDMVHNTPHVDMPNPPDGKPIHTALLYLDGVDGDTVFFNERFESGSAYPPVLTERMRVQPKPNTLVFFNSAYYHASSSPRYGTARCALNIVFYATDTKENQ